MPKYRRGSGSIYKKRSVYYIAYYTPDGKQVCESTKTKDKAEARRLLQARLGQLAEGRYVGPSAERITFADLAEMILDDYRVNNRKTLAWVKRRTRLHLAPFFGDKKAHEISTIDIKAYIVKRQGEEASNGEINLELASLKRMFNLALRAEKITKKPYIPMLAESNVRQGFFERAEFDALFPRLPDALRGPVVFAYRLGWRIKSEVFPLRWSQIDLEEGTVRLEVGTTKNKGGRLIYLTRELQDIIEAQWQEHLTQYPDCPFVFHRQGERIKRFEKAWATACKEAGLVGKIPHDFRRTAVRNMVRAGIPERVAMMISGHKTRAVFDRYHIVSDGDLKEAARKLEGTIPTRTTTTLTTLSAGEVVSH